MEPRSSSSLVPLVRSDSRTVGGSVCTQEEEATQLLFRIIRKSLGRWPGPRQVTSHTCRHLDSNGPEVQASEVGGN